MAKNINIDNVIRGDTALFNISVPDIDITNAIFRLTIKNISDTLNNDSEAVLSISWDTTIDEHNTVLQLTPEQASFAGGSYKYDIQLVLNDGQVHTIIYGIWNQIDDVTKTIT